MLCREFEKNELVAKYVGGQLDPAAQDEFEIHMLDCESCRASVEILQVVREDLLARDREIRAYSPKPRGGLRWRWIAIPATCVLVLAIGVLQWTRLRHSGVQTAHMLSSNNREVVDAQLQKRCAENPSDAGCFVEEARVPQFENRVVMGAKPGSSGGLNMQGMRARANTVQVEGAGDTHVGTSDTPVPMNGRDYRKLTINGDSRVIESRVPPTQAHAGGASDKNNHQSDKPARKSDFIESMRTQPANQEIDVVILSDDLNLPHNLAQDKDYKDFAAEMASLTSDKAPSTADALKELASVQAPPYAFSGVAGTRRSNGTGNSVVTGGNNSADLPAMAQTIFHEAMLAYAEKRYGDAETLLQSAIQSAPGSIDINYYLGICRLLGDRANEAIEPLQFVLTKEKSPYSQAAHFYLSKAYLQMQDITHAESELKSAATMPGRLTGEAKSTLAKLQAVLFFESEKKDGTVPAPDKKDETVPAADKKN